MKRAVASLVVAAFLLTFTCRAWSQGVIGRRGSGGNDGAKVDPVAEASNQFGADLYGRLAADEKGNVFFSPFGIETALAMTCAGARGQTAEQMARTLHFHRPPGQVDASFGYLIRQLNASGETGIDDVRTFDLVVANALWADKTFAVLPGFKDRLGLYGGGVESVDFAGGPEAREKSRQTINQWVEKQTHDKIRDLVPADRINPDTRLLLTNAVYFKSRWEEPFQATATREEPFRTDPEETQTSVKVPMMHQTRHFKYAETDELQAVELPYALGRLSMVVLLPKKADGLAGLEKSLSSKNLAAWRQSMTEHEVELSLPKFKFTSRFDLARTLQAMGMKDAFGNADFSGMTSSERVALQDVIHQAFVDVNEEGTEAAAATAVAVGATMAPVQTKKVVFRADHPFLFAIRHNESGTILFLGRVTNPKS